MIDTPEVQQLVAQEPVVAVEIFRHHTQKIVVAARHRPALDDLRVAVDRGFELGHLRFTFAHEPHFEERVDGQPDQRLIEQGDIAFDEARGLELLHAARARSRRQRHAFSERRDADPGVALKLLENPEVRLVDAHRRKGARSRHARASAASSLFLYVETVSRVFPLRMIRDGDWFSQIC
jgi:hypothetical protein